MRNTQNITIGLLLVTAVVLGSLVVATYVNTSSPAYADTSVAKYNYIMCTGAWSKSQDFLYVIDIAQRKMNVYFLDQNRNALEVIDQTDLRQAFSGG